MSRQGSKLKPLRIKVLFDTSLHHYRIGTWICFENKRRTQFKISNRHLSLSLPLLSWPLMPSPLWSMLSPFKLHHRVIISNRESHRIWFESRNTSLFLFWETLRYVVHFLLSSAPSFVVSNFYHNWMYIRVTF